MNEAQLSALRTIYETLQQVNVNWVLTGSVSFALRGAPVKFPTDIDIQSDREGAYEIQRAFSEYVVKKVAHSSTRGIRSHFGELRIRGVTVEIIGDIEKQRPDGTWESPPNILEHREFVTFDNMNIPVLSLQYEHKAYLRLGRAARVSMIEELIRRHEQAVADKPAK